METPVLIEKLRSYQKACNYQKQVNSNKAKRNKKYHNWLVISTIISTIILAAIGFGDSVKLSEMIGLECQYYYYLINFASLFVLILSILNLLFRYQERSINYYQAVIVLAELIKEMDILITNKSDPDFKNKFELIHVKYATVLKYLPQHTDKEFLRAKYDIKRKREVSNLITNSHLAKWKICLFYFLTGSTEQKS